MLQLRFLSQLDGLLVASLGPGCLLLYCLLDDCVFRLEKLEKDPVDCLDVDQSDECNNVLSWPNERITDDKMYARTASNNGVASGRCDSGTCNSGLRRVFS